MDIELDHVLWIMLIWNCSKKTAVNGVGSHHINQVRRADGALTLLKGHSDKLFNY